MKKEFGNPPDDEKKPHLRGTFSARNLLGGREILNQITEFCSELKKLGSKNSKKATEKERHGVLSDLKEREDACLCWRLKKGKPEETKQAG